MKYVHRIKKYIFALAAVLALLQTGCTPVADADMLAYQRSAAHAEVKGCFGDTEFGALIELSAMPSDGSPRAVRAVGARGTADCGCAVRCAGTPGRRFAVLSADQQSRALHARRQEDFAGAVSKECGAVVAAHSGAARRGLLDGGAAPRAGLRFAARGQRKGK